MATQVYHVKRGFTMLEMLVAITATVIMVLFLNQIFSSMSGAVSAGKATSSIIETARVTIPQLLADQETMLGPDDDGFLVLINRTVQASVREGTAAVPLRSDQVVWIRRMTGEQPTAPGQAAGFENAATAPFARVWYGHALRTAADGSGPVAPMGMVADLGQTGPNQYAASWILARQCLLLSEAATPPISADGAWAWATVGDDGDTPSWTTSGLALFHGVTDVAACALADDGAVNSIIGNNPNPAGAPARLSAALTNDQYRDAAYAYTFAAERLRINPEPTSQSAWQVGQMHGLFAEHCTEFIVQFAADFNVDGHLDTVSPTDNRTRWYDIDDLPTMPVGVGTPIEHLSGTVPTHSDATFIFKHNGTDWPWMLRLRYRLVDPAGKLAGADGRPGKVFEQILRVNRK